MAGFRALQRALRHHKAGQVVQAAQDMLTLLSSLGIPLADSAANGHDDMNTARQWLAQPSSLRTPDR